LSQKGDEVGEHPSHNPTRGTDGRGALGVATSDEAAQGPTTTRRWSTPTSPDESDLLDYINAGDKWLTDIAKGYNLSKEADAFMWPGEIRELTDHLTDLEGF
jgi:hypothetical protein